MDWKLDEKINGNSIEKRRSSCRWLTGTGLARRQVPASYNAVGRKIERISRFGHGRRWYGTAYCTLDVAIGLGKQPKGSVSSHKVHSHISLQS